MIIKKKKQKKRDQGDQFLSVANILLLLEADIFPFFLILRMFISRFVNV